MSSRIVKGRFLILIAIHCLAFFIVSRAFQLEFCYRGKNCFQINELTFEQKWRNQLENKLHSTTSLVITNLKLSESNYLKLFSHPLPNLKKIQFKYSNLTQSDRSPKIYNPLTPPLVQKIFTSPYFIYLRSLDLSQTNLQFRHFSFLSKSNLIINSNLQQLILNQNLLDKLAFQLISNIRFNGKLQTLELAGNSLIQNESIESILKIIKTSEQDLKTNLKRLNLHFSSLKTDGLIKILENIDTSKIQHLDIGYHAFQHSKNYRKPFNNTLFKFIVSCNFSSLKSFNLSDLDLDQEQLPYLKQMKLPSLEELEIGENFITDDYFQQWITVEKMPRLKTLGLRKNSITDQAIKLLIEEGFPMLQSLDLSRNRRLSPNHLKILQKMNSSQWKHLDFSWNSASKESLREFFENRPFLNIQRLIMQGFDNGQKLFEHMNWKSMGNLKVLQLLETDLSQSSQYIQRDHVKFPNLRELTYGGQWLRKDAMDQFINRLAFFAPQLQLFEVQISSQQKKGGYFNFSNMLFSNIPKKVLLKSTNYMTIFKPPKGNKFQLVQLFFLKRKLNPSQAQIEMKDLSFFGPFSKDEQSKSNKTKNVSKIFQFLYDFVDFRNIEAISSIYPGYLTQFFKLVEEQDLRQSLVKITIDDPSALIITSVYLPYLRLFQYKPDAPFQYDPQFLQVLKKLKAPLLNLLTFVGDPNQNNLNYMRITNQIISQNLNINQLIIISSKISCKDFMQIVQGIYMRFLIGLGLFDTQLTSQCLAKFISNHMFIRQLYVYNSTQLAIGFFDQVLIKHELILTNLKMGNIGFEDEEFSKFAKVNREFISLLEAQLIQISSNGLKWLAGNSTGFIFPKVRFLDFSNNFFNEQGPRSLFVHGLPLSEKIRFWPMTDLMVNNQFLEYPSRLKFYNMYTGHFIDLKPRLDKRSLRHVEDLHLDSPYAFFQQNDFHIVSQINLSRVSTLTMSLKNVFECKALESVIKIIKYVEKLQILVHYIKNKAMTLKDSCLQQYSGRDQAYMSHLRSIKVNFVHEYVYIPKFYTYVYSANKRLWLTNLTGHELTDQDLTDVFANLDVEEIVFLDLKKNFATDAFLQDLFKHRLNKLELLTLTNNQIQLINVHSLIGKKLLSLKYFFVGINEMTDQSIDLFTKAHYPSLLQISFQGNAISLKGFLKLMELDAPLLEVIYLTSTLITEEDLVYILQYVDLHRFPHLATIKTNTRVREINSQRIKRLLQEKYKLQNLSITYIIYRLAQTNQAILKT